MNTVSPRIAKRLHLFRFPCDMCGVTILYVPACGAPLKVAIELDPVRRIQINALHLTSQALALSEARHHLQRVAEDHSIRPVLVVLIELGLVYTFRKAVEICEQIRAALASNLFPLTTLTEQVVDKGLWMNLLLDV